ncbi:hypothetical protein K450DRAFT_248661 [Umbelopsis ramanniana AG]|uniref:Uncharacterized protein n=1 Tax=Umbelopsis ramanniana AG TaxID=1314678 RepID=A0AAD5HBN4_UMBRA|nr:uncharacterized protein K450DRAFT_248661 [Umbelopsis ramanniana AG]KAI8578207.1 hypothetical protein K450DRAFT_248661 [Umbelopsis ramanniana AG]
MYVSPPPKTAKTILSFGLVYVATAIVVVAIVVFNTIFLDQPSYEPDHSSCSCDCWDRKFKGEYYGATQDYKAVYFNMTSTTVLVFLWTLFYILLIEQFIRKSVHHILDHSVRYDILLLAIIGFYGNYYNWWATWNYLNDSFYMMFTTQMFFNVTEFIPSLSLYVLLDEDAKPSKFLMLISASVSMAHLFLSLSDQGWYHIATITGKIQRDIAFIISDLVLLYINFMELTKMRIMRRDVYYVLATSALLMAFYHLLD